MSATSHKDRKSTEGAGTQIGVNSFPQLAKPTKVRGPLTESDVAAKSLEHVKTTGRGVAIVLPGH